MNSIIFRHTVNHEYPLSKNIYNFQGSMSLFLWLCFFITYLTLPLNLYWKQFVFTCDIVIIEYMFVVCKHFLCQKKKVSQRKVTSTASSVENIRKTSVVYLDTLYPFGFLTAFSFSSSGCFLIETNLKSPKTNHLYKHFETLTS